MKTYEITIDVREVHRYEVKANNEEEAENKLFMRDSWPDPNNTGSEDVGEGMSVSVADYDNDGDPDLFVTNYGDFCLYRNNKNKTFTDVT